MDKKQTLEALSALAQETRLDIFRLLVRSRTDGLFAGEISARLALRQNTVSTNLGILARAQLVRNEREGRSIRYFADLAGVRTLLTFLLEDCCGGQPEVCESFLDRVVGQR